MDNNNDIGLLIGACALSAGVFWLLMRKHTHFVQTDPEYDIEVMETDIKLPRGYRNNNPLNMNKTNIKWLGKINPSTDPRFEQFENLVYGYRAAIVNMRTGMKKYGANTIEKIVSRWAPESENHTDLYIRFVSNYTDIPKTQVIGINDKDSLTKIVYAMALYENGETNETKAAGLPNMEIINEAWRAI